MTTESMRVRGRTVRALQALGVVLLLLTGTTVSAQGGPPPGERTGRGGGRMSEAQRAQFEKRLEERINQIVKQRLAPTDEQFAKLRDVARRVEDERRAIRNDEMRTRFALRRELLAGDKANEGTVAELLDQMQQIERRRLELSVKEQGELAKFLSPTQRAKYIGLQDELRRGMQDVQRGRLDDSTGGPMGRRRPPKPPGTP